MSLLRHHQIPRHEVRSLTTPGLTHGFFGRQGGVSQGLYTSLNCGFGSHDEQDAVRENRRRIAETLGHPATALVTPHQIHSTKVVTIKAPWGTGEAPQGDGLVTRVPGIILGVLSADCAPLLFADRVACVIAAAHAGWKGALGGVAEATVAAMEKLGAVRANIAVAIGPCIGQESYQVGPEFEARFIEADGPRAAAFFSHSPGADKRPHFALAAYLADRLKRAGLAEVESLDVDTAAEADRCFSYRRACLRGEPDYGREMSAIALV